MRIRVRVLVEASRVGEGLSLGALLIFFDFVVSGSRMLNVICGHSSV
jgi:hypothetical protein